jgi:hypothetical protein
MFKFSFAFLTDELFLYLSRFFKYSFRSSLCLSCKDAFKNFSTVSTSFFLDINKSILTQLDNRVQVIQEQIINSKPIEQKQLEQNEDKMLQEQDRMEQEMALKEKELAIKRSKTNNS